MMVKYFLYLGILFPSVLSGEAITKANRDFFSVSSMSEIFPLSIKPAEKEPKHTPTPLIIPDNIPVNPPSNPTSSPKIDEPKPSIKSNPYAGRSGVGEFTGLSFPLYANGSLIPLTSKIREIEVKDDGDCTLYALNILRNEFIQTVVDAITATKSQQELEDTLSKTQEMLFDGETISFFNMDDFRLRADTIGILKDLIINPDNANSKKALVNGYDGRSTSTDDFSEIKFNFNIGNKPTIIKFVKMLYSRTVPKRNIPTLLLMLIVKIKKIKLRAWTLDRGAQFAPFTDQATWKATYKPDESTVDSTDKSADIIDIISIANHTNLGLIE
jgi:hypothetical protein